MKISINKSRPLWWVISAVIIIAGVMSMVISWQQIGYPLRPGLDFVGGSRLQVERDCSKPDNCKQAVDIATVREVAKEQGLENSSIQISGKNGVLIRSKELKVEQRTSLLNALSEKIGEFDPKKTQIDTCGPTLGRQLFSSGIKALSASIYWYYYLLKFSIPVGLCCICHNRNISRYLNHCWYFFNFRTGWRYRIRQFIYCCIVNNYGLLGQRYRSDL